MIWLDWIGWLDWIFSTLEIFLNYVLEHILLFCFYEGYVCLRSQALEGAFNEFSVDLTDEEQTAENILDVLRQAVMGLYNTIMEELKKKHALKVN